MSDVLQMPGLIVAALGTMAIAFTALWLASIGLRRLFDRATYRIFEAGVELGAARTLRELEGASWWFSEDATTRSLLGKLAIGGLGVGNVEAAREVWRRKRGAQ